jgi:hypothetical protein
VDYPSLLFFVLFCLWLWLDSLSHRYSLFIKSHRLPPDHLIALVTLAIPRL